MIKQAETNDFEAVKHITQTTIRAVYPKYYPEGAVDFFCRHHSAECILSDIEAGKVYILEIDNSYVGTVTIDEIHINRLFVLPDCQHKGYGRMLMDFAEEKILTQYDHVELDASFPAKKIYIKRGYRETEYNIIETASGDKLCYDVMVKEAT